ncbi:Stomatin [uncultured archaeon]|nr:Stomatin [uncultured archaeon]
MVDLIAAVLSIIFSFAFAIPFLLVGLGFLGAFFKIIRQYERGILFAFGKYAGTLKPGLNIIIPFYHRVQVVDLRLNTLEVPKQEVMTKDNVPVNINAVIYFKVNKPEKAVLNVEDYNYAVAKYGQTSLRNVSGEITLDQLLSERQQIADKLRIIVDKATEPWGIEVVHLELQDIEVPDTLKRTMAKQAEAERERRAVIISSEGDVAASGNLAKAAALLGGAPGALHLRTLQSLNDIASDETNSVIFIVPLETLRAYEEVD